MSKLLALTLLFLCFSFVPETMANTTQQWCGTFYIVDNKAFLRIPKDDIVSENGICNAEQYKERSNNNGTINIALNFTLHKGSLNNWSKFNNHLIEIRGKLRNGMISNTRFIRDNGI